MLPKYKIKTEAQAKFRLTPRSKAAEIGRTDYLDEPWLWDVSDWGSEGGRTARDAMPDGCYSYADLKNHARDGILGAGINTLQNQSLQFFKIDTYDVSK